jgi:hypothetical protein
LPSRMLEASMGCLAVHTHATACICMFEVWELVVGPRVCTVSYVQDLKAPCTVGMSSRHPVLVLHMPVTCCVQKKMRHIVQVIASNTVYGAFVTGDRRLSIQRILLQHEHCLLTVSGYGNFSHATITKIQFCDQQAAILQHHEIYRNVGCTKETIHSSSASNDALKGLNPLPDRDLDLSTADAAGSPEDESRPLMECVDPKLRDRIEPRNKLLKFLAGASSARDVRRRDTETELLRRNFF